MYDRVGNKRLESKAGTKVWSAYNGFDQLTQTKNNSTVQANYTYDANGNLMVEAASQTTCYDYDPDNNLTKVRTGKNVNNASNVINANTFRSDGQRISKTEGNVKTNYFYQGGSVLYTKNGSGNRTSFNLYSPDGGIIASKRYEGSQNNRYISYVKDIRTSTSTLIDEDGGYLSSYKYSDFGETVRANNANILNEICYTGGIYDASTSMYYLNSRYYDPWKSNFISQDTYRGEKNDPGTWNLYAYCADNPINYIDPTGHKFQDFYEQRTQYLWYTVIKMYKIIQKIDWGIDTVRKRIQYVAPKAHVYQLNVLHPYKFSKDKVTIEYAKNRTECYIQQNLTFTHRLTSSRYKYAKFNMHIKYNGTKKSIWWGYYTGTVDK